jgi:hypothetical protein
MPADYLLATLNTETGISAIYLTGFNHPEIQGLPKNNA